MVLPSSLELPATADCHVHLRQGKLLKNVIKTVRDGGCSTVFVMPNLSPPIDTVEQAEAYHAELISLEPRIEYLMSLYMSKNITPETVRAAKKSGKIHGIKVYPQGVTTGSEEGVVSLDPYYPVLEAMQQVGLVLNLHGEVPSGPNINMTTAEAYFLPTLLKLHKDFPSLKIVLEHCTTRLAVENVRSCGPNVAGTITAHHLSLTRDDVFGDPWHFCKPVAKSPQDREALCKAAVSGDPKFFFGSDSAPHPLSAKHVVPGKKAAAGVFTAPACSQLVLSALEEAAERGEIKSSALTQQNIVKFLSTNGRAFYGLKPAEGRISLTRDEALIPKTIGERDSDVEVAVFKGGNKTWGLEWLT
ncbi:MAG: hypothetical protein M1828_005164 [Chrysothrix sp. TS-e1954]|nr:MAG: hypothetical protein M1828_005164 [Chrysothrix sp. TS-e1954]